MTILDIGSASIHFVGAFMTIVGFMLAFHALEGYSVEAWGGSVLFALGITLLLI